MNKFQKVASKLAKIDNLDITNGESRAYYREARNDFMRIFKSKHWFDESNWNFQDVLKYKETYIKGLARNTR